MRVGSLFAGIGGFDLAARWMGWETAWVSEIDPFACAVLQHHFPEAPNLGDIRQIDWSQVERPSILVGGFPCQPASAAGKRKGTSDDRWLWPECARAVRELRPRWAVFENVRGLLSVNGGAAFAEVLGDLGDLGYAVQWHLLSAADVGAPHKRERVWIVAHTEQREGEHGHGTHMLGRRAGSAEQARLGRVGLDDPNGGRREQRDAHDRAAEVLGAGLVPMGHAAVGVDDANGERGRGRGEHRNAGDAGAPGEMVRPWAGAIPVTGADGKTRLIPADAAQGGPKSEVWPVAHGVSHRVAQLRAVGNSIVPACAYTIFQAIAAHERALTHASEPS